MQSSQLNKQAPLRESVLAIVGLLMLCFAGYNTFYKPKQAEVTTLKSQVTEIEAKIASTESLIKTLQQKNKIIEDTETTKASSDYRVQMLQRYQDPVFKSIGEFLQNLTQSDFKGNLSITTLKHDLPVSRKGYSDTKFTLSASGSFMSVVAFIQKIEAIPALITLDNVEIKLNPKDATEVTVLINGSFFLLENGNA